MCGHLIPARRRHGCLFIPLSKKEKRKLCTAFYLDSVDIGNLLEVLRVLCWGCIGNEPMEGKVVSELGSFFFFLSFFEKRMSSR